MPRTTEKLDVEWKVRSTSTLTDRVNEIAEAKDMEFADCLRWLVCYGIDRLHRERDFRASHILNGNTIE